MAQTIEREVTNITGVTALPRSNGELVFESPWGGRAFGVTVALTNAGLCKWKEFNSIFIEHIAMAENSGDLSTYYQRWLAALEELAVDKGLVSPKELEQRIQQLSAEDHHG